MPKRHSDHTEEDGDESRAPKRPKPDQTPHNPVQTINSGRQLSDALVFKQDSVPQLRNGIASFKALLDALLYDRLDAANASRLAILREFLDNEKPADVKDTDRPFLHQLWQAWSFANQNNHDYLASAIVALIAQLTKVLSVLPNFEEQGLLLCRTVLQHQHLRLVKRCFDAPKHKDFLIAPSVRLLTELVSFDGGVLAREAYQRREQTFDVNSIRRNLGLFKATSQDDENERKRKPSVRTLTVRYVLALLKLLHEGGKTDILKSRPVCVSIFFALRDDPSELVCEILQVTEQSVLRDSHLPRSAKANVCDPVNLDKVAAVATQSPDHNPASEQAFSWLKSVLTIQSYGVLREGGWYPPGTTKEDLALTDIDLGLSSISFYDRDQRPDVRNNTLLNWVQRLKPHVSERERELLLTAFRSAPELVSAYFFEKHIHLEAKLSDTFLGYASFLFETISLPVPRYLGNEHGFARLPPQSTIMLESIIPRPLNQRLLTRCLNIDEELITLFAVRILTMAFEKAHQVLSMIDTQISEGNGQLWSEAAERLRGLVLERCPPMKDIISTFRKTPEDTEHAAQRNSITRLLQLYYQVLPAQAMEEHFDISSTLDAVLYKTPDDEENDDSQRQYVEHLLQIAKHNPGVRWFTKQGSLSRSPILTVLKMHAKDPLQSDLRGLVGTVLEDHSIVTNTGLTALIAVLTQDTPPAVDEFLDDCLLRASKKPVKYLDDLSALRTLGSEALPSILASVMLEQAPFVATKPKEVGASIELFITTYVEVAIASDDGEAVLRKVKAAISAIKGFHWRGKKVDAKALLAKAAMTTSQASIRSDTVKTVATHILPFTRHPDESLNRPELFAWQSKDIDLAVEDGQIAALILCLSSADHSVRTQAHKQLHKAANAIFESEMDNKEQLYILVGSLIETYETTVQPKQVGLPYIVSTFASRALEVQNDPSHLLYSKVNQFLAQKGPTWNILRLHEYWTENTFLSQPADHAASSTPEEGYWQEALWVLSWLCASLRTLTDLDILRRTQTFEVVLALATVQPSTQHQRAVHERALELLFHASCLPEGSNTIITRAGALAWLHGTENERKLERAMKARLLETCDRARIEGWSGRRLEEI